MWETKKRKKRMNEKEIFNFLDNLIYQSDYIRIPKPILKMGYSLNEAGYFMNLYDMYRSLVKKKKIKPGEPFYFLREKMEQQLNLSTKTQQFYNQKLINEGLLIVERVGSPPKNFYKFNLPKVYELFMIMSKESPDEDEVKQEDHSDSNRKKVPV